MERYALLCLEFCCELDLSGRSAETGLDSASRFHLPLSTPISGVSSWCSRAAGGIYTAPPPPPSGFSVVSAIATRILARPAYTGGRFPVLERFLLGRSAGAEDAGNGEERAHTRRRGQTPLTFRHSRVYRRVTWFLGHIVPDTFYPSIAGGSGPLSRLTCTLSLGPLRAKTQILPIIL